MAPKRRFDGMPRVTLKNISRIEKGGCGWRVHIKRKRKEYPKYFPDGWDGPFESLRTAIEWRDTMWAPARRADARAGPGDTAQFHGYPRGDQ